MRKAIAIITTLLLLAANSVFGEEIYTLEQAKSVSAQTGKLILLKFFKEGWEYCEQSAREAETDENLKTALETVVLFPIDIDGDTGADLEDAYKVGSTFPVFILANSKAEIIARWIGYTGSGRFINSLKKAKSDLTTVDDRIKRFNASPSYSDAHFLAQYTTDSRDYLDAVSYFRKCEELGNRDFSYDIFKNTANAIWRDMADFNDVFPAADAVINAKRKNSTSIIGTARSIARLARKKDRTDKIARYLQAGVEAASSSPSSQNSKNLVDLKADYALYADKDTSNSLNIKRSSLGNGWANKPEKFYAFSKWCTERKINLQEAEYYTRKALKLAQGEEFQAKVMANLADIVYAKGNLNEAISIMEQVIQLYPEEESYFDKLRGFKGELKK